LETNYTKIIRSNLETAFTNKMDCLQAWLPAERENAIFYLNAFGDPCEISADTIRLNNDPLHDPRGVLISMYVLFASAEPCVTEPFKAFKEFSETMPYEGAFHKHTEHILTPHVGQLIKHKDMIMQRLEGSQAPAEITGDDAFIVRPLPKIALCYIIYEADEDFEASVTCLYSVNADEFLPADALADVAEYTSQKMIEIVEAS